MIRSSHIFVCRVCGDHVRVNNLREHLEAHNTGARKFSLSEVMELFDRKERDEQRSERVQAS
jgi:hypothetical protein